MAALIVGAGGISDHVPAVPIARASDPSSNIPGVPLSGPIATGRLGGAIYDVVYSVSVSPGYVIVASLTGSTGTDFDLYLFDSTATTVISDVGLLRKSTGPTSTEAVSYPSQSGGTYYIDLNGATDVQGDYRLAVQVVPDQTPPVVSIVLADGRAATNQASVPVTLTAADDLSGVADMAFSADGVTYTDWVPFTRLTTFPVTPGDGPRTVWAKVRNGVGLVSAPTSATIMIDTAPPVALDIVPREGASVLGLRPRFTVSFNEPIAPASWTDLGLIVQSAAGDLVQGDYTYDVNSRTGTFVPSSALQPGSTYIVTIGSVRDIAGNQMAPRGSWTVFPLAPVDLTARATPGVLGIGGQAQIEVRVTGAPAPTAVTVETRPASSATFALWTVLAVQDAQASLSVRPQENTVYRFTYGGADGIAPAQAEVRVLVRRVVGLVGISSTVVSRARVGRAVTLTAQVSSVAAGVPLSFRLYRFDTRRRAWVYAGSRGRGTDANGRAVLVWTPPSTGSYYWRVYAAPTPDLANNVSAVYRWSVGR